jgi:hypothetical protein
MNFGEAALLRARALVGLIKKPPFATRGSNHTKLTFANRHEA